MPGNVLAHDDVLRLQQILATESASITMHRLADRNSGDTESLREHLGELQGRGLVAGDGEEWRVTDAGIERLKGINQYDQVGILYDTYSAAEGR